MGIPSIKYFLYFLLLFVSIFSQSCRRGFIIPSRAIPLFGLGPSGEVKTQLISKDIYAKHVGGHLGAIQIETEKVLRNKEKYTTGYRPVQVILGLALSLDLGFSPLYNLSIRPSFQLWFRDIDAWN